MGKLYVMHDLLTLQTCYYSDNSTKVTNSIRVYVAFTRRLMGMFTYYVIKFFKSYTEFWGGGRHSWLWLNTTIFLRSQDPLFVAGGRHDCLWPKVIRLLEWQMIMWYKNVPSRKDFMQLMNTDIATDEIFIIREIVESFLLNL